MIFDKRDIIKNKRIIKKIILSILFISGVSHSANFNYKVMDKNSGIALDYYGLSNFITLYDIDSQEYLKQNPENNWITDIPVGKYQLTVYGTGHIALNDTLTVSDENQVIKRTYYLDKAWIKSDTETELYHDKLSKYQLRNRLIDFKLTDIKYKYGYLTLETSFINLSNDTLYLLKTTDYIQPLKIYIENEDGYIIDKNTNLNCDYDKVIPNSKDLLTLVPRDTLHYGPLRFDVGYMANYNEGEYNVKLLYNFTVPEYLTDTHFPPNFYEAFADEIKTLTTCLRIPVASSNHLSFYNDH